MHCQWPVSLNLKPPFEIQTGIKKDPYALVILKTLSVKESTGEFKVTSWRAGGGPYNQGFVLKDRQGIELQVKSPVWQTTSVLKPGSQAFPPYGPWKQEVLSPYVVGISGLLVLCVWGGLKWWIRQKTKWESEKIKSDLKGQDPYDLLLKEVALLSRKVDTLPSSDLCQSLKDAFVFFLQNMFEVKLDRGSFKNLKNRLHTFAVYRQNKNLIDYVEREITSVLNSPVEVSPRDVHRLIQLLRKSCGDLYKGKADV